MNLLHCGCGRVFDAQLTAYGCPVCFGTQGPAMPMSEGQWRGAFHSDPPGLARAFDPARARQIVWLDDDGLKLDAPAPQRFPAMGWLLLAWAGAMVVLYLLGGFVAGFGP